MNSVAKSTPIELTTWKELAKKYCPRCIMRHLCMDWGEILKTEVDIKKHLEEKLSFELNCVIHFNQDYENFALPANLNDLADDFCYACLGLLRITFLEKCVTMLTDAVASDTFQFTSYQSLCFFPVQLILSAHASFIDFRQIFGEEKVKKDIPDVKEVFKALLEPIVSARLAVSYQVNAELEISFHISHVQAEEKVLPLLKKISPKSFESAKNFYSHKRRKVDSTAFTIAQVKNAISKIDDSKLVEVCASVTKCCEVESIDLHHTPVYVAGRYNKYSRTLPQTPWFIDGVRKIENSVEEHLAKPVQFAFKADTYSFSSSGREDVDVRMLGSGRPFLIELSNPKCSTLSLYVMQNLENQINNLTEDVQVQHLQIVDKQACKRLKEGEAEKTKSYSATCCFVDYPTDEQLSKLKTLKEINGLVLQQKTPIRVLHRRPLAVRPKIIHSLNAERLDNDERVFKLQLSTQAGTYVKEFVHGDFGRTMPSLGNLLGGEVDIIDLDVMSVDLKWPPHA